MKRILEQMDQITFSKQEASEISKVESLVKYHVEELDKCAVQLEELKKDCSGSPESLRLILVAQSRKELHNAQRNELNRHLEILKHNA